MKCIRRNSNAELPLKLDRLELSMVSGLWDSIWVHCRLDNDLTIDLKFDHHRDLPLMNAMFYDWFPMLISIDPLSMRYRRFDYDHIQCYSCYDVAANAHECQPSAAGSDNTNEVNKNYSNKILIECHSAFKYKQDINSCFITTET